MLVEFARAGEALAQEDALLGRYRLSGGLAGERLCLFTGAVDTRRALTDSAVVDLRGAERAVWQELAGGSAYTTVGAAEERLLDGASRGRAVEATVPRSTWDDAHARVRDGMRVIEQDAGRSAADRADPFTRGVLTPAGAAVLFGLLAVATSLVISVRIGRDLVVELVTLRNSALEIARRKLPEAMRRLRAGEEIDIRSEAPPRPPPRTRPGRSPRLWAPCTGPPCARRWNAPNSPAASPGSSSTSPAAARSSSTANSACWTAWNAAPTIRTSSATSSASTTSPPACGAMPKA
ncbi:hypothetical protein STENM223S_08438 [Streptomyces tendae]